MTTRTVFSRSKKRKCTSSVLTEFGIQMRYKANDYTEMVVYKTKLPSGRILSTTRHEIVKKY